MLLRQPPYNWNLHFNESKCLCTSSPLTAAGVLMTNSFLNQIRSYARQRSIPFWIWKIVIRIARDRELPMNTMILIVHERACACALLKQFQWIMARNPIKWKLKSNDNVALVESQRTNGGGTMTPVDYFEFTFNKCHVGPTDNFHQFWAQKTQHKLMKNSIWWHY